MLVSDSILDVSRLHRDSKRVPNQRLVACSSILLMHCCDILLEHPQYDAESHSRCSLSHYDSETSQKTSDCGIGDTMIHAAMVRSRSPVTSLTHAAYVHLCELIGAVSQEFKNTTSNTVMFFAHRHRHRSVSIIGGTKHGIWGTEAPSEVQAQSPDRRVWGKLELPCQR